MKLRQINENLVMQQLRGQLMTSGPYFARPNLHTTATYNPYTGHDAGSRAAGFNFLTTGVPQKPAHRRFLGFEKRLGTIRL